MLPSMTQKAALQVDTTYISPDLSTQHTHTHKSQCARSQIAKSRCSDSTLLVHTQARVVHTAWATLSPRHSKDCISSG